jgi:hypothetical protein
LKYTTLRMQPPRKPRFGCLTGLLIVLLLGTVVYFGIPAVFYPWSFFMGGRFHLLPGWQGWGRMHSTTAGDYLLYVWMQADSRGRQHSSQLKGRAILCTPRGEKFPLTLSGGFEKHMGTDTNGKTGHLSMYTRHILSGDDRPRLELYGMWHNPDLVMDDHGTLANDFQPDGTLWAGKSKDRQSHHETLSITLHEGKASDFEAACAAIPHR